MFLILLEYFGISLSITHLNVLRCVCAGATSFILALIGGSWFIAHSQKFQSAVREYTPDHHQKKNNTPTMGGLFILASAILSTLLWAYLGAIEVWILLGCLVGFGTIGFWDDIEKIRTKRGIPESYKFGAQCAVGLLVALSWYFYLTPPTELSIFGVPLFSLGICIIPWAVFIVVGVSNAVNLTDGLDGLAAGSFISTTATFSLFAFITGHALYTQNLNLHSLPTMEIAVIGAALVGATLGFLWFNGHPAQVFMGDVGSLALGSSLACIALMVRQELLLALAGGIFVAETLSVILQVIWYKYTGRRMFKMAPLHHHFEMCGWPETKITLRLSMVTAVLCILSIVLFFLS